MQLVISRWKILLPHDFNKKKDILVIVDDVAEVTREIKHQVVLARAQGMNLVDDVIKTLKHITRLAATPHLTSLEVFVQSHNLYVCTIVHFCCRWTSRAFAAA